MDHRAPRLPTHSTAAYHLYGPATPDSPVIVSVPHAGRDYDLAMLAQLRVGPDALRRLEDRRADLLAHGLIARGLSVIVARTPRAFIDLNRDVREIDPDMLSDAPRSARLQTSAKLRGGLGLVPRRMPGVSELWRGRLNWADVQQRITAVHAPYHAAIAGLMLAARDTHGHAILVDLHSMPSIPAVPGRPAIRLVLGDRFGRSCSTRLMALAADVAAGHGYATAQNHPYAGDHILERHGRPALAMHALQIELDRATYLDAMLDRPAGGLPRAQSMITAMVEALAVELPRMPVTLAAE